MIKPSGGYQKRYLGGAIAGEGGIYSSIDDMLRWLAHMNKPFIGNAATWATMVMPQTLANGTSTGCGLGLMVDRYRGLETVHHAGNVGGWNSQMLKVPRVGLDIVILANREGIDPSALATRILDQCVADLDPIDEVSMPPALGVFRSPRTGRVIRLLLDAGQQIVSIDGTKVGFASQKDGTLRPVASLGYLKWTLTLIGDLENPSAIEFDDFGHKDEFLQQPPAKHINPDTIVGRYRSDATDTDAKILAADGGLRLTTTGRFGSAFYSLQSLADSVWQAKLPGYSYFGGILSFADDGKSFSFSTLRTRALGFRREL
jgi:hypothetical protein